MNHIPNKKEARRLATHGKIIEAATHLFATLGFHKTTIQDIAQHIGMTTGAVFHHFGSKKDILDAVVENLDHNFEEYIEFLAQDHVDRQSMITGMAEIFVERFHTDPDIIISMTSLAAEFSSIRGPVIQKVQAVYDRFVDAFEAALNRFSLKKINRAVAIGFIAGLQGVAVQALLREGEMTIEELVQGFLCMNALGKSEVTVH